MQKVLLVYYEPIRSGQTTHVLSLVRGIDRSRCQLTVVLPDKLTSAMAEFDRCGVKVVPLRMGKLWWGVKSFRALAAMIRQERYDIVHIHSQEAGVMGRVISKIAGARRVLYTPQTVDIRRAFLQWAYILVEVLLSHLTERIISVNEVDRKRLIRWGIHADKIVTIPNGIDLSRYEQAQDVNEIRQNLGMPANCPLVMQVGRLSPQKDPLAFVEGAAQTLRLCPQARFVMLGDGPMQAEVEALIREKGLAGQVLALGHRPDAACLISAADVVTLTSRWEGTPYSLMEAMAWKKPVVATTVNGCRELVLDGQTGFLVGVGKMQAWSARVMQLLNEPATRARFGEAGYLHLQEGFSLENMIARLEMLYFGAVDRNMVTVKKAQAHS